MQISVECIATDVECQVDSSMYSAKRISMGYPADGYGLPSKYPSGCTLCTVYTVSRWMAAIIDINIQYMRRKQRRNPSVTF
jgi:hypothetical protein